MQTITTQKTETETLEALFPSSYVLGNKSEGIIIAMPLKDESNKSGHLINQSVMDSIGMKITAVTLSKEYMTIRMEAV